MPSSVISFSAFAGPYPGKDLMAADTFILVAAGSSISRTSEILMDPSASPARTVARRARVSRAFSSAAARCSGVIDGGLIVAILLILSTCLFWLSKIFPNYLDDGVFCLLALPRSLIPRSLNRRASRPQPRLGRVHPEGETRALSWHRSLSSRQLPARIRQLWLHC